MFSFSKLVTLILLIAGVWLFMRWLEARRQIGQKSRRTVHQQSEAATKGASNPVEDLVQCRVCGVYGPSDKGRSCDRPDCPY